MAQLKHIVEPFGEVNVYPGPAGRKLVVATILMEPHKEGAQTGIALDGSGSMSKLYGVEDGSRVLSSIFGGPKKLTNEVTPVAQQLCAYLARKIDADGGTTCIYWAVGMGGGDIEVVGDLRADEAERHVFGPPKEFGTGTQLLPAVRYFVDRFRSAPWGFYVFITDGELHDLDDVKQYSVQLAREIAAGRRNPLKLVLIGLGTSVNETQMTELDDLDSGTDVDLWDHKLAAEMRCLQEIFAEVVDKNTRVADNGRILGPRGQVLQNYTGGLPAYLEFEVPADADSFVLEVNGVRVTQPLSDHVQAPVAETWPAAALPKAPLTPPVPPVSQTVHPAPVVSAAAKEPPRTEALDAMDLTEDPTWRDIPLEFEAPADAGSFGLEVESAAAKEPTGTKALDAIGEQQASFDLEKPKDKT